jgi:hypothetical protein
LGNAFKPKIHAQTIFYPLIPGVFDKHCKRTSIKKYGPVPYFEKAGQHLF